MPAITFDLTPGMNYRYVRAYSNGVGMNKYGGPAHTMSPYDNDGLPGDVVVEVYHENQMIHAEGKPAIIGYDSDGLPSRMGWFINGLDLSKQEYVDWAASVGIADIRFMTPAEVSQFMITFG